MIMLGFCGQDFKRLSARMSPNLKERLATINNIELKDIREHYRRTHTAKNMRFIIAGQIKHRKKEILRNLEDWDLKEGKRFEIPKDKSTLLSSHSRKKKGCQQYYIWFFYGYPKTPL